MRFGPVQLLAVSWLVTVVALAGPAWRHEPAPFAEDTAALAIVVRVAPSMKVEDIQPSRLARSVQKIHDLLGLRPGAKTALIAYAGTAHLVMPATKDGGIVTTFADALDPKIMPEDGDVPAQALRVADQALAGSGSSGTILWIADNVAPEQRQALATWRKASATPVRVLAPLLEGPELATLRDAAGVVDAKFTRLTADSSDVEQIARDAKFSTAGGGASDRWEEGGYWLTPILFLCALPFARRGWMAATAAR